MSRMKQIEREEDARRKGAEEERRLIVERARAVAANLPEDAAEVLFDFADELEAGTRMTLTPDDLDRLERDARAATPLWEAFQAERSPVVLACSEWP